MAARTGGYLRPLPTLILLLIVLLGTKVCKAYGNAESEYNVYMIGGLTKLNEEKAVNVTCCFQEVISDIISVAMYRKTKNVTQWEKLLEATPDMDEGRAKLVKTLNDTKVMIPKGSLTEKSLNLFFTGVTDADTGEYSCKVADRDYFNNANIFVDTKKAVEFNKLSVQLTYDIKLLNVNKGPLLVMTISCRCAKGSPDITSIALIGFFRKQKYQYQTLVDAYEGIYKGDAMLTNTIENLKICCPRGSVHEKMVSILMYNVTYANSGEFKCSVDYVDEGTVEERRYIYVEVAEETITGSPIKSNGVSLLDEHGEPAFRVSMILFCSIIGFLVVGVFL